MKNKGNKQSSKRSVKKALLTTEFTESTEKDIQIYIGSLSSYNVAFITDAENVYIYDNNISVFSVRSVYSVVPAFIITLLKIR